ncbi:hypothetical protein JQ596_13990 [Bradyrhizobium manausense]|uniref:hypothetical protein n=1 Tax=Bradyrhizobium manausense TaxID=989370 RepID=UPI001BA63003|nr:hypothetical protein [Bradyrhizobium manausense]MBR0826655.1 hypothetical protein [Bradyrhizobium manausense]UVO33573.1 hypothetical protein KUF59_42630 [Bradyrhizobium arachidis]
MCVELLTYADLSARLKISREAARALARRRRLPRSRRDDGKALVSVDFSELRYTPRPRCGGGADHIAASMAKTEASEPLPLRWNGVLDHYFDAFSVREPVSTSLENASEIEAFKAEIARLEAMAADARADFERERERADRLDVELKQAAAETTAANAWVARLEEEVAALRTGRSTAGQAALRLGHLAAAIVGADRAARR